ncbi:MAG: SprT-like domain-containing protein [Bacteroidota bacterium]
MRKFVANSPLAMLAIILFICSVSFFVTGACRKMNKPDGDGRNEIMTRFKFFRISPNTNTLVKAISESIKQQDKQRGFVPELASTAGYPVWDKAFVATNTLSATQRITGGGTEMGELVYIPFVRDHGQKTNAILIVKVSGTDTLFRLFYGSSYASLGFGLADQGSWSAKDLFHTFITFDNVIFGHTYFVVKNKRLITGFAQRGDTTGETLVELTGTENNFKLTNAVSCHPITVCGLCAFRVDSSDHSYRCCNATIENYCTTYWYDDGSGNIIPPIGGGGGSTSGWENPCRPIPGIDDDPCSGGNGGQGWEPVDEEDEPDFFVESINDSSITDPCLKHIIDSVLGQQGHMMALNKLYDQFQNNTDKYKFVYEEDTTLINSLGQPSSGHTEVDTLPDGRLKVTITLNPSALSNASQEFVTTVILHEIIHAFLLVKHPELLPNTTSSKDP